MRKLWPLFALLALLALNACAPQAATSPTATVALTPTGEKAGADTEDGVPTPVQFEASGPATCTTAGSLLPTPDPTVTALFPRVSEGDWATGPVDAQVTILEYSDFQ